jgi:hypothetical protein
LPKYIIWGQGWPKRKNSELGRKKCEEKKGPEENKNY